MKQIIIIFTLNKIFNKKKSIVGLIVDHQPLTADQKQQFYIKIRDMHDRAINGKYMLEKSVTFDFFRDLLI